MFRPAVAFFLSAAAAVSPMMAAAGEPSRVELNGQTFAVADGWSLELAAAPPLVDRPVSAGFDDRGRLFVTESSGSNEPVETQLAKKPHRLLMLEDADGDGAFDRRTVFADGLMLPQGCLWHDGWVYVATPPTIERFRDIDGDGVADEREVWFDGGTLSFCANDIHGPYLGPDGVLYWTKGAFEEQRYPRPGGGEFVTRAAHVFRHSPVDGSVEPVLTGGMDNPVEVAWTAAGDGFCCATFVRHPDGGRRDGLVALTRGGYYGKRHGVLDAFPRVGDLLDPTTHLGAAAPAGLCRPRVGADPAEPTLLCAQFNTRRVSRHRLIANGAGVADGRRRAAGERPVRLPPDRHPRRRRRQPADRRHRRLVQALLPDLPGGAAGRARDGLPAAADRAEAAGIRAGRPPRAKTGVGGGLGGRHSDDPDGGRAARRGGTGGRGTGGAGRRGGPGRDRIAAGGAGRAAAGRCVVPDSRSRRVGPGGGAGGTG